MAAYVSNPAGSGDGGYVLNPFAGGGGGSKTAAYASAVRNYTRNPFAGEASAAPPAPAPALAEHLLRGPDMDPDLLQAYRDVRADPRAAQYQQTPPDIDKLWRLSPGSPVFKSGYEHNPYVLQRRQEIIAARNPPPPSSWEEGWYGNVGA